jgi:hypothetical protein
MNLSTRDNVDVYFTDMDAGHFMCDDALEAFLTHFPQPHAVKKFASYMATQFQVDRFHSPIIHLCLLSFSSGSKLLCGSACWRGFPGLVNVSQHDWSPGPTCRGCTYYIQQMYPKSSTRYDYI